MTLTLKKVERLTTKGKYADERGLYLQVHSATNRSWLFRYKQDGKTRWMGLGSVSTYTLEEMREQARKLRQQIHQGLCPLAERHKALQAAKLDRARDKTFAQCTDDYFAFHSANNRWTTAKSQKEFKRIMAAYVYPHIGPLSVASIDRPLVLQCLDPLAKPNTAKRVQRNIKDVLDYAIERHYRLGPNPAAELKHTLANKKMEENHHAALPYGEASRFMAALRAEQGIVARALEMAVLTACRTQEVIGAQWAEIDFENKVWTIPADRMKMKKEHKVPLCPRAIELLQGLPRLNASVFPASKADHISKRALARQLRGMGYDEHTATVHGFRATFKTWASETTAFANEISEMCLAHKIGNAVEAAYRRGDLFIKRAKLMQAWADYLVQSHTVVSIGNAGRTAA